MTSYTPQTKHTTIFTPATDPAVSTASGQMIGFFAAYTYNAVAKTAFTLVTRSATAYTAQSKN